MAEPTRYLTWHRVQRALPGRGNIPTETEGWGESHQTTEGHCWLQGWNIGTKGTLDFSPPHVCLIRFLVILGFGGASAWAKGLAVEILGFWSKKWWYRLTSQCLGGWDNRNRSATLRYLIEFSLGYMRPCLKTKSNNKRNMEGLLYSVIQMRPQRPSKSFLLRNRLDNASRITENDEGAGRDCFSSVPVLCTRL